ncbi:MAG: DUF4293 domain-containing protein [Bacteroidales bacterium]|nr:DUF4293 domain-containing protein [Bacteroidales bacterium]
MLQRIQTLYLLLTTALPLLFLKGNFLRIINRTGNEIVMKFSGIYQSAGDDGFSCLGQMLPVSVMTIIIPSLSVLAISLYKKRKFQMKVVAVLIVIAVLWIGLILYYSLAAGEGLSSSYVPGAKLYLAPLVLIFGILAYRGIRRDENLVSSYDRLR